MSRKTNMNKLQCLIQVTCCTMCLHFTWLSELTHTQSQKTAVALLSSKHLASPRTSLICRWCAWPLLRLTCRCYMNSPLAGRVFGQYESIPAPELSIMTKKRAPYLSLVWLNTMKQYTPPSELSFTGCFLRTDRWTTADIYLNHRLQLQDLPAKVFQLEEDRYVIQAIVSSETPLAELWNNNIRPRHF
jgi:hypothetical protein